MLETEGRGPIKTIKERCCKCYACIRSCPTKSIAVREDCVEVLHQRCIGCGKCIQACSQNAKVIADAIRETEKHLSDNPSVVAVMGCSYPAFFYDLKPGQVVSALKKLGFSDVFEGSAGVELIAPAYRSYLEKNLGSPLISSHCPTIVDLVERHYPQLLRNLIPVVSPMVAIGRFIKACRGSRTKVVYISSCIGGKFEIESESVEGAIDTVLTYNELNRMLGLRQIDPHRLAQSPFSGIPTSHGRSFSIYGGPFHVFGIGHDGLDPDFVSTVGEDASLEVIRDLSAQRISPRYVDVRFCNGGCIGGPGRTNRLTSFSKRKLIIDYQKRDISYRSDHCSANPPWPLRLNRTFSNKQIQLELPGGHAIKSILQETDKHTAQDELNCGGCGYSTCRKHAVAVYQGLAETRMCLPYSLKRFEQDRSTLEQKYDLAQRALAQEYEGCTMIGDDPRTRGILQLIQQVGPTPTTTLIRGESGTGKELTARAIHQASLRSDKSLVTVNCTTLSDIRLESELFGHKKGAFNGATTDRTGLFEAANGGTIFLDEIGDTSAKVQADLLQVLDTGELTPLGGHSSIKVDVRIIAATNKALEDGIEEGWFREDLFYRINVFTITLPPLRNRLHSIPQLVKHFLNQSARKLNKNIHRIDDLALEALSRYHWPGNIRELQNIIERAVVLSPDQTIRLQQLPVIFAEFVQQKQSETFHKQGSTGLRQMRDNQLNQVETDLLCEFLNKSNGNVTAAARLANIPRRTFYRMLKRHQLDPLSFRKQKNRQP